VLSPGVTYRIASDELVSSDSWREGWTPGATVQSNFTVNSGCYATGGQSTFPNGLAFTNGMYNTVAMVYDAPTPNGFTNTSKNSSVWTNRSK
jgi:hypothetical protein